VMDGGNLCNDKPSRTLLTTCHSCFACLYFIQIPNSITTIFDIQDLSLFRLKKKTPVFLCCSPVVCGKGQELGWLTSADQCRVGVRSRPTCATQK